MGMNFYMTCIYHQPFEVRLADQDFQQLLPNPFSAPTEKSLVYRTPFPIVGRQVTPGSSGAQHPKDPIHKSPIILGYSASLTTLPRQMRPDDFPRFVTDVVSVIGCFHFFILQLFRLDQLYHISRVDAI